MAHKKYNDGTDGSQDEVRKEMNQIKHGGKAQRRDQAPKKPKKK